MSALEDLVRQIVVVEVEKALSAHRDFSHAAAELEDPTPCLAEMDLASGHTLKCTELGSHSTHRFSVDL